MKKPPDDKSDGFRIFTRFSCFSACGRHGFRA
jgi:hypothetical protein